MKKRILYIVVLEWMLILAISFSTSLVGQESSNLPIVKISTEGQIMDKRKVAGEIVIYHGIGLDTNRTTDTPHLVANLGVEYRGQTSLNYPKKGMGIEFRDDDGEELALSIFGWPEATDWVIHSPYADKSLMRNAVVYGLGRSIMPYAPRSKFVDLYINDFYYGVCLLTEKIDATPGRVPANTALGGAILKFDKETGPPFWTSEFTSTAGSEIFSDVYMQDPDPEELSDLERKALRSRLARFDNLMGKRGFNHPENGYKSKINVASLIDYILITEFTRNIDAYRISTYFYVTSSSDDRLYFGPLWDYNLAMGNANYCEGGDHEGWAWNFNNVCPEDVKQVHFWWKKFLQDPAFRVELKNRWQELRTGALSVDSLIHRIEHFEKVLKGPAEKNFTQWPVLGEYVSPNNYIGESYADEVGYLKSWILKRVAWMDRAFQSSSFAEVEDPPLFRYQVRPNPSDDQFVFHFNMGKYAYDFRIQIHEPNGYLLHDSGVISNATDLTTYDWRPPKQGIYFARIEIDGVLIRVSKMVKM